MFRIVIILSLLGFQECLSQALFTQASSLLYIGSESNIQVDGNAIFNGELSNNGHAGFSGDANFGNNQNIGNVELTGATDQLLQGKELVSERFELNKNNRAIVESNKLDITKELILNSGILSVSSSKLTVLSGLITGGSEQSFVTGGLSIISTGTNNLLFPVGMADQYEAFTIHSAPIGEITVECWMPDPNTLVPGDSLIGLADEAAWELTVGENVTLNSQVSINYNNLDLQNFPLNNPIRANKYAPTIACLTENSKYNSMGVGDGSDETIATFGKVVSRRSIQLSDSSIYLSIGIMPMSDGLKFYVPSIFTPMGTMTENKKFRSFLLGAEIEKVEMNVWDKFNNKIFSEYVEDTPLEETGWDGQFTNGMSAPQGIYYYRVLVTSSGGFFEKTGTVLLAR